MNHPDAPAPPVPVPDELSEGFWEQARNGVLTTQQCDHCGTRALPPTLVCTRCHADPPSFRWSPVSGDGRVATWTVVRDALLPGFADAVPYVVAEVEIPEQSGLRIVARLRGVEPDDLRIGLPVRVAFTDGGEGTRVPIFERAAA